MSVFEREPAGVEPFVKEMGDKMDYTVAMDDVPKGHAADAGFMATNWMAAAHQEGIPTAFVVDKETKIAWIGHPMELEEPLGKIVAGKWDVKAESARAKKLAELNDKLGAQMKDHDFVAALKTTNDAIAENPGLEERLGALKLSLLKQLDRSTDASSYLGRLIDTVFKDNAVELNALVWPLVDPDSQTKPSPEEAKIALRGAIRADELSKLKDAAIADTLAAAYHAAGNDAKAIATQERVLMLAKGTDLEKDPSLKAHLEI